MCILVLEIKLKNQFFNQKRTFKSLKVKEHFTMEEHTSS